MKREIVSKRRQYVKENIMRMTVKEIAEVWGVSHSAIEKDLILLRSNEGLKSKSELKQQRIKELLKKEYKVKEIAEDIKITERSVYYQIKKVEPVN